MRVGVGGSRDRGSKLGSMVAVLRGADTWKAYHPTEAGYTYYSKVHGSFSHLDYLLVPTRLLQRVSGINILTRGLSDHSPVALWLHVGLRHPSFRLPWYLRNPLYKSHIHCAITEYFSLATETATSQTVLWEAKKPKLRAEDFSFCTGERKRKVRELHNLELQMTDLEKWGWDCTYHQFCSTNFGSRRNIPKEYSTVEQQSKKLKVGCPSNEEQHEAFLKTCSYLDSNDAEHMRTADLISKMEEYLQGSGIQAKDHRHMNEISLRVYRVGLTFDLLRVTYHLCAITLYEHMKRKLVEYYGDDDISGKSEKADVVTQETTNYILRIYQSKPKDCDTELQTIYIIEAAAKLIKRDVKSSHSAIKDVYPATSDLNALSALDYLPSSLRLLCSKLFVGTDISNKVGTTGQSVMQAIGPRALICPFQTSLRIQLQHSFRSRYLIDVLHNLGFCSFYNKVAKFEQNAALDNGSRPLLDMGKGSTIVLAANNVYHSTFILDVRIVSMVWE
ncbi:hypothetical protein NDU88_006399 [Pleurodeles waltl]|uniref:Uncharacterized protein n=1 Tax=Pleurodeles waltl TaxID=8319 RepID=A0AAV7TWR4_PLEWA|nr:hypothetical protein NDU88_006399 [Pleurodeles waltl]